MLEISIIKNSFISLPSIGNGLNSLSSIAFSLIRKGFFIYTSFIKKGNPVMNYRATNTPQCFLSIDCVGLTKSRLTSKLIQIFFIVFLHWSKAGGDPTLLPYRINALSFYRLSFEVGL